MCIGLDAVIEQMIDLFQVISNYKASLSSFSLPFLPYHLGDWWYVDLLQTTFMRHAVAYQKSFSQNKEVGCSMIVVIFAPRYIVPSFTARERFKLSTKVGQRM